ncbi:MAG: ABC transporter permease [Candidatus Marinimicrobia bacterium]|nr:ABC transporter permease [Candidatus Neomarinimicrobiota bacterium]
MQQWFEALKMALEALKTNKLRSFLTLVGIIAGVASIVAVMTGISVIQKGIESELSVLGTTTFQVQKWLNGPSTREERINAMKWPPTTVEHANAIRENVNVVDLVGSELWGYNRVVQYKEKKTEPQMVMCGGTPEYGPNNTHLIALGRNISNQEIKTASFSVVIGHNIAHELFPYTDPIGKTVKIDGRKFNVVGVFEAKNSVLGGQYDNYMLVPISTFERIYGKYREDGSLNSVNITVNAKSPELLEEAIEQTRLIMRQMRSLKPNEPDNFTIFTNQSQIDNFNRTTAGVKVGAFVIGIIALIVAGIGIMNIMLVSVTERTREIGLRKSLGATRKNILTQFLIEAIMLCNIGGVFGVLIGYGLGNILQLFTDFQAYVPLEWAIGGLAFCTAVGLTFGMWPAIYASRLDPIESLRFE